MSGDQRPRTTAEKTVEQAEALELLAKFSPLLRIFGARGRKASAVLDETRGFAAQARELAALPGGSTRCSVLAAGSPMNG
jgi:hypothetical protein